MATKAPDLLRQPPRNVRLDTLIRLRWLAIAGQSAAVAFVYYGLDFDFPIAASAVLIGASAWLNIALRLHFRMTERLTADQAAWLLAFDVAQLAGLLFLTGGLENPFAFLLLWPVVISATALPRRLTLLLGTFAMVCATGLRLAHYRLPWVMDEELQFPTLYLWADWLSILLAIGFIGAYAWQVAEDERKLADALTATELVLAREKHLSQLDGLAAAAAHELGTPLATITVVARELERSLDSNSPHAEDVRLLREQAQRCRDILAKLTELSSAAGPFDRMALSALIEDVVAPHRHSDVHIEVMLPPDRVGEPVGARNPGILYGLGNLLENAVDFARARVEFVARWSDQEVVVTIADDGPGFSPEVIDRIGEPYVTSRAGRRASRDEETTGLGLGFFIAKTLLERSGATLARANRAAPETGAVVRVRWTRADFETAPGETA